MAGIPLDASQAYQRLGVKPVINAAGSVTKYGGTRTRPEVLEVMAGAARIMVNVEDLNRKAGEDIARLTGAEAGFVCSGAAGGLVLPAAACIAGKDPVKMRQLPDTTGMKDEFIIQNMHRFPYEQAYRAGGAKLVEIGDSRYSHPWELEGAIGVNTAAVAFLCAPMTNRRAIPWHRSVRSPTARAFPSSSTPRPCSRPVRTSRNSWLMAPIWCRSVAERVFGALRAQVSSVAAQTS